MNEKKKQPEKNAWKITDLKKEKYTYIYIFVPQISYEWTYTLGISTLIKMFDLYSFFISFVPRLFPSF